MPRATFAGITFDLLVQGLDDRHTGFTTVREVPAGPGYAYIDLGGAMLARRVVNVLLDNEAQYYGLAALPGTPASSGTLSTDDGDQPAVLLSVNRYYRRGGPMPQLCRTEWVFPLPGAVVSTAGPPGMALPEPPAPAAEEPATP